MPDAEDAELVGVPEVTEAPLDAVAPPAPLPSSHAAIEKSATSAATLAARERCRGRRIAPTYTYFAGRGDTSRPAKKSSIRFG